MEKLLDVLGHPAAIAAALLVWVLVLRLLLVGQIPAWRLWVAGVCALGYIVVLIVTGRQQRSF